MPLSTEKKGGIIKSSMVVLGPGEVGTEGCDAVVCFALSSFPQISFSHAATQGLLPLLSPFVYSTPQWEVVPDWTFLKKQQHVFTFLI